jgi:hypothetical protein
MADAGGSTNDALRAITTQLEQLNSSLASHENVITERNKAQAIEMSSLSERITEIVAEQTKNRQEGLQQRTSQQRPSRRDLDRPFCSRSSSQSPSNNRHGFTMDWGLGHPNAHVQGQTSDEQDGSRGVRIFDSANSNFEKWKNSIRSRTGKLEYDSREL